MTLAASIASQVAEARRDVLSRGWALIVGGGTHALIELVEALGRVLHVEEVAVAAESRSLVKSVDGLTLHTDHHRADFIVWHCITQSEAGGETLLADGLEAYRGMSPAHREALTQVLLQEHSVFIGDHDRHPLITFRDGQPRIYYSYWLSDEALAGSEREAFESFATAVAQVPVERLRLGPGDVLAIDNGRMLHGRTPIEGSQGRHLRRYWIEAVGESTAS